MNAITPAFAGHPRRASTAFVQMRSGACVDLLLPDLSAVTIEDIATNLARTARFNGATLGCQPYSVAQHSLHVAQAVEAWGYTAPVQLCALFHDAAEAITGDVVTPMKMLLGPAFAAIEWRIADAIRGRFRLPLRLDVHPIPDADAALLATERRDLLADPAWDWPIALPDPLEIRITPMPSSVAYTHWLNKARDLGQRCGIDMDEGRGVVRNG